MKRLLLLLIFLINSQIFAITDIHPALNLSQEFVVDEFIVSYPENWIIQGDRNLIILANSQEVFETSGPNDLELDDFIAFIYMNANSLPNFPEDIAKTPRNCAIFYTIIGPNIGYYVQPIETFRLNEQEAFRTRALSTYHNRFLISTIINDEIVTGFGFSYINETGKFQATLEQVIANIKLVGY